MLQHVIFNSNENQLMNSIKQKKCISKCLENHTLITNQLQAVKPVIKTKPHRYISFNNQK